MLEALIGGGLALGGIGTLLGADSQRDAARTTNEAAERARQQTLAAILNAQAGQSRLLYGGNQGAIDSLRGLLSREDFEALFGRPATSGGLSQDEQAELEQLRRDLASANQTTGRQTARRVMGTGLVRSSAPDARQQANIAQIQGRIQELERKAGGDPGVSGRLNREAFMDGSPGLLSQYQRLADDARLSNADNLARFSQETGDLLRGFDELSSLASTRGQGRMRAVDAAADDAIIEANRRSSAMLGRAGLGQSSILGNQIAGNTRAIRRDAAEFRDRISDDVTGDLLGIGGARLGQMGSRLGQQNALRLAGQDRLAGFQMQPLQLTERTLAGPLFNAATGVNYSAFNPGASSGANATYGSFLGNLGGLALGYGLSGAMAGQQVPIGNKFMG